MSKTKAEKTYREAGVTYCMETSHCPASMREFRYFWNYNGNRGEHTLQTYNHADFLRLLVHWNRNDRGWRFSEIAR